MEIRQDEVVKLDPYECIAKRNRKYASECTEVYLSNKDGTELSDQFRNFESLEVLWFNGNKLSKLDNLDKNFRVRQVYVQDNRIVSLAGLRTFKFLQVLLASNNQLRDLEKQIGLLSRFNFLARLDLFGNPVAEEPDYRLRIIKKIPRVEILDMQVVKESERVRADEVVGNEDKVSMKLERVKPKTHQLSVLERDLFREARDIRERRRKNEEDAGKAFNTTALRPLERACLPQWFDVDERMRMDAVRPQPHEAMQMEQYMLREMGFRRPFTQDDVQKAATELSEKGLDAFGRVLANPLVFESLPASPPNAFPEVRKLVQDPEATASGEKVVRWLLTLEWHRKPGDVLDRAVRQMEAGRNVVEPQLEDINRCRVESSKKVETALATLKSMETQRPTREVIQRLGAAAAKAKAEEPESLDSLLQLITAQQEDMRASVSFSPSRSSSSAAKMVQNTSLGTTFPSARTQTASKTRGGSAPAKARADFFTQSFLRPKRAADESTGRLLVSVGKESRFTMLGTTAVATPECAHTLGFA